MHEIITSIELCVSLLDENKI